MGQRALASRHGRLAGEVRPGMPRTTRALAVLDGFLGLSAAAGAVLVVSALPEDPHRFDGFTGDLVPAVGLGLGSIHGVDDPVTAYTPALLRRDSRLASITFRDLLEMRSGLDWSTSGLLDTDDSVVYSTTALRQALLDQVRMVTAPAARSRGRQPHVNVE